MHRYVSWLGSYYQYANRLAVLDFFDRESVSARLLLIYFVGDEFPDDTPCPASEEEWRELITARRLTLGLPKSHQLSPRIHDLFLPAIRVATVTGL